MIVFWLFPKVVLCEDERGEDFVALSQSIIWDRKSEDWRQFKDSQDCSFLKDTFIFHITIEYFVYLSSFFFNVALLVCRIEWFAACDVLKFTLLLLSWQQSSILDARQTGFALERGRIKQCFFLRPALFINRRRQNANAEEMKHTN